MGEIHKYINHAHSHFQGGSGGKETMTTISTIVPFVHYTRTWRGNLDTPAGPQVFQSIFTAHIQTRKGLLSMAQRRSEGDASNV